MLCQAKTPEEIIDMEQKRLLNTKEAANLLRCSRATLYRMIKDHQISTTRVRGTIRIEYRNIEKYLCDQKACNN